MTIIVLGVELLRLPLLCGGITSNLVKKQFCLLLALQVLFAELSKQIIDHLLHILSLLFEFLCLLRILFLLLSSDYVLVLL